MTLDSCAVAQGNLSVTVNRQPMSASQIHRLVVGRLWLLHNADRFTPERRFAAKRTFQRQLNNVVRALNALGATPMDLMSYCNQCKVRDVYGQNWKSSDDSDSKLLASAAWDAQSLNELRRKRAKIRRQISVRWPARWKDVRADDVEKHARRFTKRWPVSSEHTRLYTSMYDQQIAQQRRRAKVWGWQR